MADLFNDVLGDAIAVAVRRAVDDVGRTPLELGHRRPPARVQPVPVSGDGPEVVDLRDRGRFPPAGVDDPYEVLGVGRSATWDHITAAHRRLARAWHPDGAAEDEREVREDLIRRLNAAYAELRTRRGH